MDRVIEPTTRPPVVAIGSDRSRSRGVAMSTINFGTRPLPDGSKNFVMQLMGEIPPKELMRLLKKLFPQEWQEVNLEIERVNGNIVIP